MSWDLRAGCAALAAATAVKLALAAHHDPMADEAYYWVWSLRPALGYYDQPPLTAWVLAVARQLGDHALALRLPGILAGALAPLLLLPHARRPGLFLLWCAALPPFFWLGLFATPDALLLPAWALALAGALRGGRGWLFAGLGAGLAFLAKHSGAAVLPLLLLAADPAERRGRWPWLGLALAVALAAPNLAWNAAHGWVTVGFQLGEGLLHPRAPGWAGPLQVFGQQLGVVTPVAAIAGLAWMARPPRGRVDRMLWATSAPLLAFFALAAIGGPPDAHWPAPAWIGVGLGLSRAAGRLPRLAGAGALLALAFDALLAVHASRPLLDLPLDPGDRLREGRALARRVEPLLAERPLPVFTERYQEAALLRWHLGVPARTWPGCGRPNQYDLEPVTLPEAAWMVRPATSGPDLCTDRDRPVRMGPVELLGVDRGGRRVGRWQAFRIHAEPPQPE